MTDFWQFALLTVYSFASLSSDMTWNSPDAPPPKLTDSSAAGESLMDMVRPRPELEETSQGSCTKGTPRCRWTANQNAGSYHRAAKFIRDRRLDRTFALCDAVLAYREVVSSQLSAVEERS